MDLKSDAKRHKVREHSLEMFRNALLNEMRKMENHICTQSM